MGDLVGEDAGPAGVGDLVGEEAGPAGVGDLVGEEAGPTEDLGVVGAIGLGELVGAGLL